MIVSQITLLDGVPVAFPKYAKYLGDKFKGKPQIIVLHHTGGHAAGDIPTLMGETDTKVSVHFYIDKSGAIRQMVPTDTIAFHAGESCWNGQLWCNAFSLGIEQENLGDEPWPAAQVEACAQLCATLLKRYGLPLARLVGHRDVACWIEGNRAIWTKNGGHRKVDPSGYPWAAFRARVGEILAAHH